MTLPESTSQETQSTTMSESTRFQGTFSIEPFDVTATNWDRWLQRLEGAFKIFNIQEDVRIPYLLHYVGSASFEMLCDRISPEDPYTQTYA